MSANEDQKPQESANYGDVNTRIGKKTRKLFHESGWKALAIDPSINTVGFATLQFDRSTEDKMLDWSWGMWELDGWSLLQRCQDLVIRICDEGHDDFSELIIEWPMFYESERGQVAAQQGYTINLAAVGMYVAGWFQLPISNITLVTAPQWKGNVSKATTARRFMRQFGVDAINVDQNAIDAVMMLYAHATKQGWTLPDL